MNVLPLINKKNWLQFFSIKQICLVKKKSRN